MIEGAEDKDSHGDEATWAGTERGETEKGGRGGGGGFPLFFACSHMSIHVYTHRHTCTHKIKIYLCTKYSHTPLESFLIRKSQGKLGFLKAQLQYLLAFAKLIKALAQTQFIYGAPGMGWKERLGRDTPALHLNAKPPPTVT